MGRNEVLSIEILTEAFIRVMLLAIFFLTEGLVPFERIIQKEEYWLYKYPQVPTSFVSSGDLSWILIFSNIAAVLIAFGFHKNWKACGQALLVPTLAIPLVGITTNVLKVSVVSFCTLGFLSLYMAGQLKTFVFENRVNQSGGWRLLLTLWPLMIASLVAISRTCDYHHHWQDVVVGAALGFTIMYSVYRQYFPSVFDRNCDKPYMDIRPERGRAKPGVDSHPHHDRLDRVFTSTQEDNESSASEKERVWTDEMLLEIPRGEIP